MKTDHIDINDSIRIIESAQKNTELLQTGAAYYYKLWGIILASYYLTRYLEFQVKPDTAAFLQSTNWILFVIGGILSGMRKKNDEVKERVVPQLESVYFFTYTSFAIALFIIQLYARINQNAVDIQFFPLVLGLTVYVTGGVTKHKPSIFFGLVCVSLCLPALVIKIEYQFLIASTSAIIGSLIPGILMKNRYV